MDGLWSIFPYHGVVKTAIKRLKYRFVQDLAGEFVDRAMEKADKEIQLYFQANGFMVVPVPLYPARERWRGYNQAELVGERLAGYLGLNKCGLLKRVKNTEPLAELKVAVAESERQMIKEKYRSEIQRRMAEEELVKEKKRQLRKAQMRGAFAAAGKPQIEGQKILVVDDVWTSGATVSECARVLKTKGAISVWGFSLALGGGN